MRLRLKVILWQLTDCLDDHILALICPQGYFWIGDVGDLGHQSVQPIFHFSQIDIQCIDALANPAHLINFRLPFRLVFHFSDLFRDQIAFSLETLDLLDQVPALVIQLQYLVHWSRIQLAFA